jgi:hypothetical protein
VKSRQFCSVCKDLLEMEVVPTSDGDDDDGVIWYRCPQCQGFLPKLKSAGEEEDEPESSGESRVDTEASDEDPLRWDSPAAMMEEMGTSSENPENEDVELGVSLLESDDDLLVGVETVSTLSEIDDESFDPVDPIEELEEDKDEETPDDGEPILKYASMLAESDVSEAVPYRPWDVYEVGQCVNHLAWNDCGVVVAKEKLPGGRNIIKCYFETAGVVRLIEMAPR